MRALNVAFLWMYNTCTPGFMKLGSNMSVWSLASGGERVLVAGCGCVRRIKTLHYKFRLRRANPIPTCFLVFWTYANRCHEVGVGKGASWDFCKNRMKKKISAHIIAKLGAICKPTVTLYWDSFTRQGRKVIIATSDHQVTSTAKLYYQVRRKP